MNFSQTLNDLVLNPIVKSAHAAYQRCVSTLGLETLHALVYAHTHDSSHVWEGLTEQF